MLHILTTALNAVAPVVLLTVFGYWLKRIGFLTEQFTKTGSKMVFRICLPVTLFINVYNIRDFSDICWDVVLYCLAAIFLIFLLGLCSAVLTTPVPARRGVLTHAVFRSNFAIIGLSLAACLGGDEAMSVASVVSAFAIPLYNILGVISLSLFTVGDGKRLSLRRFFLDVVKNPMIIGAMAGAAFLCLRGAQSLLFGSTVFTIEEDIPFVMETLQKVKAMTTPLSLIVLGAQFKFSAVKGLFKEIFVGFLWRLILAPAFGIGIAWLLSGQTGLISFGPQDYPAVIALFGSPVAVSTAVIASEMGGDEQLATQLVVWTSLGSVVTVYITVCIMMATGLIAI